jgi:hypothetical protein
MPFSSMRKVTWILGTPRGAGGMPDELEAREAAVVRGHLALALEHVDRHEALVVDARREDLAALGRDRRVARDELGRTPPPVSTPSESGVTSSRSTSSTCPVSAAPWRAAPAATTSSGFTPLLGSRAEELLHRASAPSGMRVMPPTSTTCLMSPTLSFASSSAPLAGLDRALDELATEHLELVALHRAERGGAARRSSATAMNGRLISVSSADDSSCFAFSAASFRRWSAMRSFRRSTPFSFFELVGEAVDEHFWSKSSPPRNVSPPVAFTLNTPPAISRIETSNVPPPRS